MVDFVMPSLGADMEAGTLIRWRKKPGESVKRGDIIAEVETDKGVIDVDVFTSGVIEKILVPAGERVPVGTKLAIISNGEGSPSPADRPPPATPVATQPAPSIAQPAAERPAQPALPASPAHVEPRPAISPAARRRARELGVDIASLRGTGRHGAISREDVEQAAAARMVSSAAVAPITASSTNAVSDMPQQRMRQAIAAAMAKSKREIPHYYLSTTIDMQPAMNWLAETNELRPIADRLIYGVLLLKSVALALRELPEFNALWDGTRAVARQDIHVGVAIALREGGLIAPAIHHADRLSLGELMAAFRDLVKRARGGGLRSSELADSTITVTSLGDQGVESVQGVIYPPQVALLGFGKVVERPWCINRGLFARQVMIATLAADHRVSDGHRGGLLLNRIDQLLQEPGKL